MATPITGIALNCDFTGFMKIVIFAPYQGSGITLDLSVTRNLVNVGTYNAGLVTNYDTNLGAYVKWMGLPTHSWAYIAGTNGSPEIDNGSITANVTGNSSETYTVQYQYKSYGYIIGGTKPQGLGVTYQPCSNGLSKVYVSSEAKPNDHEDYNKVLSQTAQIISPNVGSILAPTHVALTAVNGGGWEGDYLPSTIPNLTASTNTKDSIWNLGLVSSSQPFTVKVVGYGTNGTNGYATGDFIEETINVSCSLFGTNGVGTTVQLGGISQYSIPQPTSQSNCVPTGLILWSIPLGSTIKIGNTNYTAGSVIPMSALTLVGSNYTGISEHTTLSTISQVTTGANFIWESACGQSNQFSVIRDFEEPCIDPVIITGEVLPNATSDVEYNHVITYDNLAGNSTLNLLQAPEWMSLIIVGNTIVISGTPTTEDVGVDVSLEFEINSNIYCNAPYFFDGINVILNCTQVSGGEIDGNLNTTLNTEETYLVTNLVGTAPFQFNWNIVNGVIVSGQGTNTIIVSSTDNEMIVSCDITNCDEGIPVTLTKNINVISTCIKTVYCKFKCKEIVSVIGTINNVDELSRVISFTPTSITFVAELEMKDYRFILVDSDQKQHNIVFKNLIC